jgi:hypothetical protein
MAPPTSTVVFTFTSVDRSLSSATSPPVIVGRIVPAATVANVRRIAVGRLVQGACVSVHEPGRRGHGQKEERKNKPVVPYAVRWGSFMCVCGCACITRRYLLSKDVCTWDMICSNASFSICLSICPMIIRLNGAKMSVCAHHLLQFSFLLSVCLPFDNTDSFEQRCLYLDHHLLQQFC